MTEYKVSDDVFSIDYEPMITVDMSKESGSGKGYYEVLLDLETRNISQVEDVYWQLSTTANTSEGEWKDATSCLLECDYYLEIEDVREDEYYLHVKVFTPEATKNVTSTGKFVIENNVVDNCKFEATEECLIIVVEDLLSDYDDYNVEIATEDSLTYMRIDFLYNPPTSSALDAYKHKAFDVYKELNYEIIDELNIYDVIISIDSIFIDQYGSESREWTVEFQNTVEELSKYTWDRVTADVVLNWLSYKHPSIN